jgi:hypothetical protein
VCHPIVNQKLPHFAFFKNGLSESTEGVEANLAATHIFQDSFETVPIESAWPEHFSCPRFKQEAALAVADEFPQHLGNERMNVHVTITGISFRRWSNFTLSTALLPDEEHRAIGKDVLPYFESKQFCDADSGRHEQNHGNPVNCPLATFDDVDDFLRRERRLWSDRLTVEDCLAFDVSVLKHDLRCERAVSRTYRWIGAGDKVMAVIQYKVHPSCENQSPSVLLRYALRDSQTQVQKPLAYLVGTK